MVAQDVDIKLSKTCDHAWGFRLSGGSDFSFPLTVVRGNKGLIYLCTKVALGGLADRAGLQAGDIVTKINGETITHLRHCEVQERILKAGNGLMMSVIRNLKIQRAV